MRFTAGHVLARASGALHHYIQEGAGIRSPPLHTIPDVSSLNDDRRVREVNVVMVMPYFWPRGGGEERHGLFLGRELVRRGHQVTFVVAAYDPSLPEVDEVDGIGIRRISEAHPHYLGFAYRWAWFRRHREVLDAADVVHCHDPITVTRWYFMEGFLRRRLPVHMTIHGYEAWPIPRSAVAERALACARVRKVIGVANLTRFYPRSRADHVVYGAAELPPLDEGPPGAPSRYLAFMGRLVPGHNPVGVIEAVAEWRRLGGAPPPLLMFGEGPLEGDCAATIERTKANAHLMGSTAEPMRWMRHAAATFCGGYLSLIEALAARVPAYCLDNDPVLAEAWRQIPVDGFVHASGPLALGQLLATDEVDPTRVEERTAAGHRWAVTQTWERMADVYEEAWGVR